jgi:hypothetical protein
MTWMPRPESDARNTSVRTAWTSRSTPMQKHSTASGSASDRGSRNVAPTITKNAMAASQPIPA